MKGKFSLRKIGGFLLAAILLSGIAILVSNTAQAQGRGRGRVVGLLEDGEESLGAFEGKPGFGTGRTR